jgi:predicted phosphate transport protein (TIGR00153 family)
MADPRREEKWRRPESVPPLAGGGDASGRSQEEQVLEDIAKFADQVVVIIEKLQDVVERFAADRYDELEQAAAELDRLESAADDTKEALLDRLALGSMFPMSRADLARLVGSMDAIANLADGAADRISMREFTLPPSMNEQLVALARADLEATKTLRDAVVAMGVDLREAIRLAREVDRIESHADDIYAELYQAMYEIDTDFKTFHQIKAIIERLENVADRCCENAELLRHMALKYLETE